MPSIETAAVDPNHFGKKLAHADKKIRDTSVKALKRWMMVNLSNASELDIMKLWKGLYYCFWMSDKAHVQMHLADNLSNIMPALPPCDEKEDGLTHCGLRYLNAFYKTMIREWHGIDRIRLDKFYMFIRKVHRSSFALLDAMDYAPNMLQQYVDILSRGPLCVENTTCKTVADSLRYHTIEALFDEMNQYYFGSDPRQKGPSSLAMETLLTPFINVIVLSFHEHLRLRVKDELFTPLADYWRQKQQQEEEMEKKVWEYVDVPRLANKIFTLASKHVEKPANRKDLYDIAEMLSSAVGSSLSLVDKEEEEEVKESVVCEIPEEIITKEASPKKRKAESQDDTITQKVIPISHVQPIAPKKKKMKGTSDKKMDETKLEETLVHKEMDEAKETVIQEEEPLIEKDSAQVENKQTKKKVKWVFENNTVKTFEKKKAILSPGETPQTLSQSKPAKPSLRVAKEHNVKDVENLLMNSQKKTVINTARNAKVGKRKTPLKKRPIAADFN